MPKRNVVAAILSVVLAVLALSLATAAPADKRVIGINVVLNTPVTPFILANLARYGKVRDVIPVIKAVTLQAQAGDLAEIQTLPYVAAVNPDAERRGAPVDTVFVEDFADGLSTWNLDSINVTDFGFDNRQVLFDGTGVYVAILDTGLLDSWRQYFPQERIAVEYAKSFTGGPVPKSNIAEQPNKWEHDQDSHGTHVTSTILGYSLFGTPINGVAPMATVIPVKVLNQDGSGWSSVIAKGITYVADLKAGPLSGSPVVINLSLGGPVLDAMEQAAIDYAIAQGVIVVAAAGNQGDAGMDYPGAYGPVISVAASGWIGEWLPLPSGSWWWNLDVFEPTNPDHFYIVDFSGREKAGQDLDVAAPGSWVVGPYQTNSGQLSYYFLGGTSMACPHVTGIVTLMAQKYPALSQAGAEVILETSAIPLPPGCLAVSQPVGPDQLICWGADATGAGLVDAAAALAATP